jgi:prevent-host-death family protein
MKFTTLRELKINPSKVLRGLKREAVVVTRKGKPAAALIPLDEDTLEEFIVAHHPTLLADLDKAFREYQAKGGKTLTEMRRKLGHRHG